MDIRLIAIDVDGTLLDDDHQLSTQNEQAIQQALAANIHIILATGRMRSSCEWIIERLKLTAPGIFIQGLTVCSAQGKVLFGEILDPDVLKHFLPFTEQHQLSFVVFAENQILTLRRDAKTDIILSYDEPEPEVVGSLIDKQIHKIIIFDDPVRVRQIRPLLNTHMGDRASVLITQPEMVEVMPPNSSKGHSLAWLATEMKIPLSQVMAIGNAENDLTMLERSGVGVAVDNSPQHIKDKADIVVPSNNASGVAEAIMLALPHR